jgi:hypothetical protein
MAGNRREGEWRSRNSGNGKNHTVLRRSLKILVQGTVVEEEGPLGMKEDKYLPIDDYDVRRGVIPSYLDLCPPELQ